MNLGITLGVGARYFSAAPSLALPPSTVGAWLMPDAASSPRAYVPNLVASSTTPGANLFTRGRRNFATDWNKTSVTITEASVTAPDGSTDATRIEFANVSGNGANIFQTISIPAGTYTLGLVARTHDQTSTVNMLMGKFNSEATKSITGTYAVHSTAIVHSGGNLTLVGLRTVSAAQDIDVIDAFIMEGTTGVPTTPAEAKALGVTEGHMLFAKNAFVNQPTIDGGEIDFSNFNQYGFTRFDTAETVTEFTASTVARRTGNTGGFNTLFCLEENGTRQNAKFLIDLQGDNQSIGGTSLTNVGGVGSMAFQPRNSEWDILHFRYDGTTFSTWLDDILLDTKTVTSGLNFSLRDLIVGSLFLSGSPTNYDLLVASLSTEAATDADLRTFSGELRQYASQEGVTISQNRIVCFEGDSNSSDHSGVTSYNRLFIDGGFDSPRVNGWRHSQGSAILGLTDAGANQGVPNSLYARRNLADNMIPADKRGREFVYTAMIGTNDGPNWGSASDYATQLGTFLAARKTAGFDYLVACTILPRNDAAFNTWRNAVNAIITGGSWATTYGIDAIADLGGDATYGTDAAASDPAKYPDGVHPVAAAHTQFETIFRAAMNGL